jgi:hypothetical protein
MGNFVSGLDLNRSFYREIIRNLLAKHFPEIKYSAGLIGYGSDVLGYDTPISADHEWGPRMLLFLSKPDYQECGDKIDQMFRNNLPASFQGYSTNFSAKTGGVRRQESTESKEIDHKIWIQTVESFLKYSLAIDSLNDLEPRDWLTFPEQRLLEITSGEVFFDGLNELHNMRQTLSYYPRDVWLSMMGAMWSAISQEEAFVGRCGDVGDEIGSRLAAARQVQRLMRLCFLIERRYAPYSKWFGTAFNRLDCASALNPILQNVLEANDWKTRELPLVEAYQFVAAMHNDLKITEPLSTDSSNYYGRPYQVIFTDRIAAAIHKEIRHPQIKGLPPNLGSINEIVNNIDVLCKAEICRKILDYDALIRD